MLRSIIGLGLCCLASGALAQDCARLARQQGMSLQQTVIAPIAAELMAPMVQLGAPTGVLATAYNDAVSVDQVLLRMDIEKCRSVAKAMIPGAMPDSSDPAAYKPKTAFDNTPWRFDMNQNGKRMTADEFSAWMEAKGVRVARGVVQTTPAPAPAIATPAGTELPAPSQPAPFVAPVPAPPVQGGG